MSITTSSPASSSFFVSLQLNARVFPLLATVSKVGGNEISQWSSKGMSEKRDYETEHFLIAWKTIFKGFRTMLVFVFFCRMRGDRAPRPQVFLLLLELYWVEDGSRIDYKVWSPHWAIDVFTALPLHTCLSYKGLTCRIVFFGATLLLLPWMRQEKISSHFPRLTVWNYLSL